MDTQLAQRIVQKIKNWVNGAEAFQKDNPTVAEQLKRVTEADISLGPAPTFYLAHIEADVTVVAGTAKDKDAPNNFTRTEAFGFKTLNFWYFPDEDNSLVSKEASVIERLGDASVVIEGRYGNSSITRPVDLVQSYAKDLSQTRMGRLNLNVYEQRINSWNIVREGNDHTSKVQPIMVKLKDAKGGVFNTVVGFYVEHDVDEDNILYIGNIERLIKQQPIDTFTSKSTKRGNRWRIFGLVFLLAAIVGGVVAFVLYECGVFGK